MNDTDRAVKTSYQLVLIVHWPIRIGSSVVPHQSAWALVSSVSFSDALSEKNWPTAILLAPFHLNTASCTMPSMLEDGHCVFLYMDQWFYQGGGGWVGGVILTCMHCRTSYQNKEQRNLDQSTRRGGVTLFSAQHATNPLYLYIERSYFLPYFFFKSCRLSLEIIACCSLC